MKSTEASKWRITVLVFGLAVALQLSAQDATPTPEQEASPAAQNSPTRPTDSTSQVTAETSTAAAEQTSIEKRLNSAATVLDEIMIVSEKGIPQDAFKDAKCILVIPSTLRVAFVFGGEHGKGVATCRSAAGWTAPAPVGMTGGSWGVQAGGEAVDLVMLVMSNKGMDALLTNKFKIGADASGAASPVGREASGSTAFF